MKDHRFALGRDGISLRWTARILSIVASGVFLFILFLVATNEDPPEGPGIVLVALLAASIVGCIAAWRWEKIGGALVMDVTIPANTAATVSLPGSGTGPFTIQESGTTVWSGGAYISGVAGLSGASLNGSRVEVQVGSGTYRFRVTGGQ